MIPPTNNFKLHEFFWKPIFTTQRYFEPISPSLTFFSQLNVVGLYNSAHECVCPALLDFFFSDPPPAGGHYCCYCKMPPTNNFKLHVFLRNPIFTIQPYFESISPSLTFFPQLMLWVFITVRMNVFVPHCWISSFGPPLAGGHYCCYCKIPPTNNFKLHVFVRKLILTTQRYIEPISPSVTFSPQLIVVGFLSSAHDCVRPSFLDFLFSEPPCQRPLLLLLLDSAH